LVTRVSPSPCVPMQLVIAPFRLSMPYPFLADIDIVHSPISLSALYAVVSSPGSPERSSMNLSVLLRTMISFCHFSARLRMSSACSRASASLPSTTPIIMSALPISAKVRSMPSLSTRSDESRMPAVSMNLKRTPSMMQLSSMVSRVVPGMSVTMALSSPTSAFSNVLFPLFGAPTMATGTPLFKALPRRNESARTVQCLRA